MVGRRAKERERDESTPSAAGGEAEEEVVARRLEGRRSVPLELDREEAGRVEDLVGELS